MAMESVTWGTLGCPKSIGLYRLGEEVIQVKKIHIMAADDDPSALFTVIALQPPGGRTEFMLGHRVA